MKKVALVTGAGAGIGRAIALRLARDDIAIGVLDLNEQNACPVVEEIVAAGGKAIALAGDIAQRNTMTSAVERLRTTFGPITVLINNAGISDYVPFLDMAEDQWDRIVEVNSKAPSSQPRSFCPT